MLAPLCLVLSLGVSPVRAGVVTQDTESLVDLAERLCVSADGDHRLTWHRAGTEGFVPIDPADFGGRLTAVGVEDASLRGFTRTTDSVEYRVLTAATWIQAPDQGQTFYRWCWVWASPTRLDPVVQDLQTVFSDRGFRSEKVRLFAWIPRPEGAVERVSRRTYMRWHNTLAREQGMRQVMVTQIGDGVSIGYASPRDEATYRGFDWAGPEPVPAPE